MLEAVGVRKLTSANEVWTKDPHCYVIVAQDPATGRVLGGTRVQISTQAFPLPIEGAIGMMDPSIHPFIASMPPLSCAEMCGMWNSREVGGMGIGSTYVNRIGISLLTQIGVSTLVGLAASWTLDMGKRAGFVVAEQFGQRGTFYYPKEDFIATAIIIEDIVNLPAAHPEERALIQDLRIRPIQESIDMTRMGQVKISYDLNININQATSW